MVEKITRIILIIIISSNFIFSQNVEQEKIKLVPIVKSVIVPGWGQYSIGNKSHGNIFAVSEALGITLTLFSIFKAENAENTYLALAAEHAGTNNSGKDYQYWVDIGNYYSIDDYNDEHLRWREYESIYPSDEKWNWSWDSDENRKKFEDMRIKSDKYQLASKFIIGGIILNHIISAIDVLYLQNTAINDKVEVQANVNPYYQSVQYTFYINL